MNVHLLTLGAYQTNCYIFCEESSKTCCVVDPGYEPDFILESLENLGLSLVAFLLTHGHFDHVGAVRQLAADTGCEVYICGEDLALPSQLTAGPLYYTKTYADGDILHLAGLDITVIHTPGHTPGSVCLLSGTTLFSGDTLFCGSCGRTDLPGGDWTTIQASLKKLAKIEADLWVLPGHGETTSLSQEKKYNPYMR